MRNIFIASLVIFNLISISILGQDLKMEIQNPILRQKNQITITFEFQFLGDYLKKQMDKSFKISSSNQLRTNIFAKDTGELQIGPFEFIFDSIKYKTNIAKVKVLPTIEPKIGIYVNYFSFDNRYYVLVEQIFNHKVLKEKDNAKSNFYETIDKNMIVSIKGSQVGINRRQSGDITIYNSPQAYEILKEIKSEKYSSLIVYSSISYEIYNHSGKNFILTNDYFQNLPADYILPLIEIR